jgi:multisubunit Na+/H+ antiporter MnhF subunit
VSRTGNFEVYYTQKLMIELWQGIPPSGCLLDLGLVPSAPNPSLAQAPDLLTQITQVVGPGVVDRVMSIIGAVAILILGWIIATIVATVIGQLLKRTEIDNQIAAWLLGRQRSTSSEIPIEKWLTAGVFWIVMVFAILAFLDALDCSKFLGHSRDFLPRFRSMPLGF